MKQLSTWRKVLSWEVNLLPKQYHLNVKGDDKNADAYDGDEEKEHLKCGLPVFIHSFTSR